MGIFQIIIFAALLLVAVFVGNVLSYKYIASIEERKTEKDMMSMLLQQTVANTTTTA